MENYEEQEVVKKGPGALRIIGFILAFIISPLGLILSIVGVIKKEGSKGLSIAGIIISAINIVWQLLLVLILAGTMAPQLVKYTAKSKVSQDIQLADTIKTSLITASMDPDVVMNEPIPTTDTYVNIKDIPEGKFKDCAEECLGYKLGDAKLRVKSGKGKVEILYKLYDNHCYVMITNTDKTGGKNYIEENFIEVGR